MKNQKLRIATRRSKLAMVQTLWVKDQLEKNIPNLEVSVEAMATQGDKILDVALAKIGDKGLFTKELETQMLLGKADIAVHSLKDLPTNLPKGLVLGCITKREQPADALVVNAKNKKYRLETLPAGSIVGTSSLRRLAQLRFNYPHLEFKDIRGNVITRLEKLDSEEFDCIILAAAGLKRLGFAERIHQVISSEISLHAVGQGALGIECKANNEEVLNLIKVLSHEATSKACLAERAFLRELEGGCQVPIGVNSSIKNDHVSLTGMVASIDGKNLIKDISQGPIDKPEQVGIDLAKKLINQGADKILAEIFKEFREK
tara:strand:- start:500 stop:1450 length:951 start_codon:yes stop_codon:yes gene_type:complete